MNLVEPGGFHLQLSLFEDGLKIFRTRNRGRAARRLYSRRQCKDIFAYAAVPPAYNQCFMLQLLNALVDFRITSHIVVPFSNLK